MHTKCISLQRKTNKQQYFSLQIKDSQLPSFAFTCFESNKNIRVTHMFCETWYKYRIPIGFLEPCITVVVCKYWLLRHCKRPADSHWPRLTITASWRKHRFKKKASSITGLRITDCGRLSRGNTILALHRPWKTFSVAQLLIQRTR